jgi:formylglycine-generating enzyme required for sulfatase activity
MTARRCLLIACTICLLIWTNCSVQKEAAPDGKPPSNIEDLAWEYYADSTALLTWTAPGDDGMEGFVSVYALYESHTPEPDTIPVSEDWWATSQVTNFTILDPATGGAIESLRVGGLAPAYYHRLGLRAGDEVPNMNDSSNVIEFILPLDATAPSAITDLIVSSPTDTSLTLSWTATGNDSTTGFAERYDIRYSEIEFTAQQWYELDPDTLIQVSSHLLPSPLEVGETETYVLSGLKENLTYHLALTAWDNYNDSPVSNIATGTTLSDQQPPAIVSDLSAYATTNSSLFMSWTAVGDDDHSGRASRYEIYHSREPFTLDAMDSVVTVHPPERPLAAGNQESYILSGLAADSTYFVALQTFDDAEQGSGLSNIISVTLPTETDATGPARIDDLEGFAYSANSITLKWTAPGDDGMNGQANLYDFYFSQSALTAGTEVWDAASSLPDPPPVAAGGSYEEFTIENLQNNSTYYIAIKTADEAFNWSRVSECIQVRTPVVTDTIPPAALTDLAIVTASETAVAISWTVPGDDSLSGICSVYEIRYGTELITESNWRDQDRVATPPSPTVAGAIQSFTIGELMPETIYYFAAVAGDRIPNWSPISPVISATTSSLSEPYSIATVIVPAGSFTMGAEGSPECGASVHSVTLSTGFEFGQQETTNRQYLDMLQWAADEGYVFVAANSVRDQMDGANVELLDLDDEDCEIAYDAGSGIFSLRIAPAASAASAYPEGYNPADHPVKEVSWYGAVAWCDWMSIRAGLPRAYSHITWSCNGGDPYSAEGYRLPTDAEWEYVSQYEGSRIYPWGEAAPDCGLANFTGCVGWSAPVASYAGGPGIDGNLIYDLGGNLGEWCHDWFNCDLGTDPLSNPVATEPEVNHRVCRGGSWGDSDLRCTTRLAIPPGYTGNLVGFRPCRSTSR